MGLFGSGWPSSRCFGTAAGPDTGCILGLEKAVTVFGAPKQQNSLLTCLMGLTLHITSFKLYLFIPPLQSAYDGHVMSTQAVQLKHSGCPYMLVGVSSMRISFAITCKRHWMLKHLLAVIRWCCINSIYCSLRFSHKDVGEGRDTPVPWLPNQGTAWTGFSGWG